jgi:tetratricopeptide (TPR) repeat protein/DNA-binding CsgD family transcriptional regulator
MRLTPAFILILFFSPFFGLTQDIQYIDSLKNELTKQDLTLVSETQTLFLLSKNYFLAENYFDAIPYKLRELKNYLKLENDSAIANCNERLGMMYYRIGNYDISSKYFLESIAYFENKSSPRMIAQITGNLANVYTRLENYQKALNYLFISKNILTQKEFYNERTISGLYINIGLAYEGTKNLDSAMFYYNKAINLVSEEENPLYIGTVLNNIGEVDFVLEKYDSALKNYQKSYELFHQINNENGMGSALSNIAKVKIKTGKYQEAIPLCNQALVSFNKIKSLYFIVFTQKQLSDAYQGLGNHEFAMKHLELYLQFNDSLKGNETMEHIANMEMEYAMNKEQQKFQILEQQAKLVEKENKLKQFRLYILIGGILVLLALTVLTISMLKGSLQRNKLKQQMLKQQQNQLQNDLSFKQKGIENFAAHIQEKNILLTDLKNEIKLITQQSNKDNANGLKKLIQIVNQSLHTDNDRKELELKIDQTHQEFINRLKTKFPKLTKTEVRLCSLLLLELSSKEIATIMNIETSSVKMGRNRLRKKLTLPAQTNLIDFLVSI